MAYRGVTARLPVGAQGFTGTANPSQAGPGHLIFAEGAELDSGIIRKDGGATLYNSTNPVHGGLLDGFVKAQLHFDARIFDAQTTFPDTSGNNITWTPAGNAQIDTGQFKFGGASLQCDGVGDWIEAADNAIFTLGSSDFTIECWFNCVGAGGTALAIAGQSDAGFTAGVASWIIRREAGNQMSFYARAFGASALLVGTTQFTNVLNTGWHHIAVVRLGNIWTLYIDGIAEATATQSFTMVDSANNIQIGARGGTDNWNGWIDEFRFSVGIARWASPFTPPTAAYADYTADPTRQLVADFQTVSLLHFSGTDASTTCPESAITPAAASRTWTAQGNAQIDTADFKFNVSSGLFDGTLDQFTTPDSADFTLGNGAFTIDFWFKVNDAGGVAIIAAGQLGATIGSTASAWYAGRTAANVMFFNIIVGTVDTSIVTGSKTYTNASNPGWHHYCIQRDGNNWRLFIDGVMEANATNSSTINDGTAALGVGGGGGFTANTWNGWIDEFRFSKGVARWTAAFQPPTQEYFVHGANSLMTEFGNMSGAQVQQIAAGIHWNPAVGSNHNVVLTSGGLWLFSTGGGWTGRYQFNLNNPALDPMPQMVRAGGEAIASPRKLFLFTTNNQVQVALGSTLVGAPISTPPADWSGGNFPSFGVQHAFRLWGGGNASDPHRMYYSTSGNHQDFTGAGSGTIAVYPGEGERLAGAVSFRGALIVFKYPRGIYVITTTDPTPANWRVDRLTEQIGTLNGNTVVQIENDVAVLDRNGNVHLLSAVNEFGDINTSNLSELSDMAPFIRDNVNTNLMQRCNGVWYAAKRQLWYGMPLLGSNVANIRVQASFPGLQQQQATGYPPRFFMSRRDEMESLWIHPDPSNGIMKPMIGDSQGYVYYMDQATKNKNGVAYAIQFSTASTDLAFIDPSLATKYKNGEFLELAYEPKGNWDLTVDVFWDDIYTTTIFFNMGGAGATLGSFVLGTDVLGSEGVRNQRKRMEGSGRRVRLAAQNAGLNQDVSIAEFHVSFEVGDERAPTL